MKMKKRKLLSLAMAAVMTGALLTGCGGKAAPADTDASAAPESAAPTAAASTGEKTALSYWHMMTGEPTGSIIQRSMDRFMADNPQYDMKVTQIANDAYKQKISIAMSSGTMPDLFVHWTGGPMIEYINSGHCLDITQYMDKDNYKDKYVDAGIAQATYNGKIYAVPIESAVIAGFFYDTRLFAKYKLEEPKTIVDLEKLCDTLKADGIVPFALANATKWTGSMYYTYLATRFGGVEAFQDAASGKGSFKNEMFAFAGQKIQEWVNKGYFNEGYNGLDDDSGQARQLWYSGKAALHLMGTWLPSTVLDENPEFYKNLGFFAFPSLEGSTVDQTICLGTMGDNFTSISPSCKDPDGAFKAITYLLDDTALKERAAVGKINPVKSFEATDPLIKKIKATMDAAPNIQLWYDQYLPPEVAEVHKSTSQEIFGLIKTPEQADDEMQAAMDAYLKK